MALILCSDISGLLFAKTLLIDDTSGSLYAYKTIFSDLIPVIEKTAGLHSDWDEIWIKESDMVCRHYRTLNCDEEKALQTDSYHLRCCGGNLFLGIGGDMSDYITRIPGTNDDIICFVLSSDLDCPITCSDVYEIICDNAAQNYQNIKKILILSQ